MSNQLKQGDSCFFHYCIDKYLTVLQCLTQCPQAMFILFPYALRYSFSSLCRLHLQCFFQNINACIRIPVDFCSRKSCRSDCSDTSLVLCEVHFHTSWLYIPEFRKTLPRKHLLWILPVYGSGSFPSRSDPRYRWFGFRAPASLTVSAGNHSADWLFSHALWLP